MTVSRRITLPDGRAATVMPADAAGEFYVQVDETTNIDHLVARGSQRGLSERQGLAARELARLYGKGGFTSPYRSTGGRSRCVEICPADGQCDCPVARARADYNALIAQAPRRCQAALSLLAMGGWAPDTYLPLWRDGLDAVALRLYGPEQGGV
jgi:hypothetical protein